MKTNNLEKLLKHVFEVLKPDLRSYYRMPVKAKIIETYAVKNKFYADVQPLRNDETVNTKEPIISKVEIPKIFGGTKRGIVAPPQLNTLCVVGFIDGDPNYPWVMNFLSNNESPDADIDEIVIQKTTDTKIKIDKDNNIITLTLNDINLDAGGCWNVNISGDAKINVNGKIENKAGSTIINDGGAGNLSGVVNMECFCPITTHFHADYSSDVFVSKG